MRFLSPAAVLLDCHNLKDRSKRWAEGREETLRDASAYFPLNFHRAFNNTTCITINLRSGDHPIKRAGLSDSDSGGGYGYGWLRLRFYHHPFLPFAFCHAKLYYT